MEWSERHDTKHGHPTHRLTRGEEFLGDCTFFEGKWWAVTWDGNVSFYPYKTLKGCQKGIIMGLKYEGKIKREEE